jgi:hypothetical protein
MYVHRNMIEESAAFIDKEDEDLVKVYMYV